MRLSWRLEPVPVVDAPSLQRVKEVACAPLQRRQRNDVLLLTARLFRHMLVGDAIQNEAGFMSEARLACERIVTATRFSSNTFHCSTPSSTNIEWPCVTTHEYMYNPC